MYLNILKIIKLFVSEVGWSVQCLYLLLYHVVFGLGLRCFSHCVYGLLLCMMSQLCCDIVYVS